MDTTTVIGQLAELQVRRLGYIRAINRNDNAAAALVRRHLGWRYDTAEDERAKLNKRARAIVDTVYDGKEPKGADDAAIARVLTPDLANYREGRQPFVKARSEIEKAMRKLSRQLSVWAWVETVRGFGDLALAVMIAEAGDLSGYPEKPPHTPKRAVDALWKRFGLTPMEGKADPEKPASASRWRLREGIKGAPRLSNEEWEVLGYRPKRNAESYAVLGDPLFRQQTMVGGPYRAVYDQEKARFLAGGKTKMHAHMHGLRCMRKAAIEDLWRVWNGHPPKERLLPDQRADTADAATGHVPGAGGEMHDAAA